MDAHRDPAVDILAPQQLGQIQRRPFDNALNIDRHEPQLERGAPDRGPPDRDRLERLREIRRAARRLERHRHERRQQEPAKTVIPEYPQLLSIKQVQIYLVMGLTSAMMLVYIVSLYLDSRDLKDTTDPDLKISLSGVNPVVLFAMVTYSFWVISRMVCLMHCDVLYSTQSANSFKGSTEEAIYHYLSLGSYAAALYLAVSSSYYIYGIYGLNSVITAMSRIPSDEHSDQTRDLYHSKQQKLVLVSLTGLAEWFSGCILAQMEHTHAQPQVTIRWASILSGLATMLVFVCMIII